MARRRFQAPKPIRCGRRWYLLFWEDVSVNGKSRRKGKRHRLAPASLPEREAKKIAAEFLRPTNQDLSPIGPATTFEEYVETISKTTLLPLMTKSTRDRSEGSSRTIFYRHSGQALYVT